MKKSYSLLALLLSFTTFVWCSNIVYPWRATTAIVKSGKSFEVWLNADQSQIVNSVQLVGPYNTLNVNIIIKKGNWVYDITSENTYNTNITVNVPANCPADRYDIVLNTSSGKVISPAGVKVIKAYKSSYYIVHFSDIHAFQKGNESALNRISTIVDIVNIINPELVFNTGDNLYRPNEKRMNELFAGDNKTINKGLNHLSAAIFTVAGNHDFDFDNLHEEGFYKEKADGWNKWWGLQAYTFKYGDGRFLAINNGWQGFNPAPQFAAIGNWLKKVGVGNLRVGLAHIRSKEMNSFDSIANLGLVLIGHNHHIANQNPSPLHEKPIQYIVNSVREHPEFNLYKVDSKTGKYTAVGNPTAQVVYLENPEDINTPALYKPKLTLTYSNANNGLSKINTATIVNKFNFPIESASVRFVMPQGTKCVVSKGKIEQEFDGTLFHIVDVSVNLEPTSTTSISIITN